MGRTNLSIVNPIRPIPDLSGRAIQEESLRSLSRKQLRKLMPLAHRNLTAAALRSVGHKPGPKNQKSAAQLKKEKTQARSRRFSLKDYADAARQMTNALKAGRP